MESRHRGLAFVGPYLQFVSLPDFGVSFHTLSCMLDLASNLLILRSVPTEPYRQVQPIQQHKDYDVL